MGRVDSAVGRVRSVNVGTPREAPWAGIGRTSIDKAPVAGPVEVGPRGLAGDQVSDTRHHGGRDKAVYAFAREQLDWWTEQLGDPLRDGEFGENLTVEGYDVDAAEIGERWQIGSVLLEVASVRTPCNDFRTWMGRGGHDNRGWVKRFAQHAHPGPYLRVLEPGTLSAGDDLVVVHRPGHGVSVEVMFRALVGEPELLPRLLAVDGLVEEARQRAEAFAAGPGMIR
ncbi:MOSC domain-containing protein [Nocardioides sp. YIM 123512]|uniref:MOSC domain-containing protein n=1 Tax=Nocardioides flavescens TaxID=2691959 RepID=A0A6L7F2G9_9ACTN|nr:MOSC domain-containing protein [Nocardioides flavescens]MXG91062.1 MOSC domain-containing protein [Nocardioides flavescens]